MNIKNKGFIAFNFVFLLRRLMLGTVVVFSRNTLIFNIINMCV